MSEISVFGSINMDLTFRLNNFPETGQTITAKNFEQSPGGKGANQSVSAAKLGGKVEMYGLLGKDDYARKIEKSLTENGVRTSNIERRSVKSGLAIVFVNRSGENKIVITPGANKMMNEKYASKVSNQIANSKILLLQLETPLKGIKSLLKDLPNNNSPTVILDPAPALPLKQLPLDSVDFLTPNESELSYMSGEMEVDKAIEKILEKRTSIILKKGGKGAEYIGQRRRFNAPSYDVKVLDTTGAGDAFNGALSVGLAKGMPIREIIEFANAAGALSTKVKGAQALNLSFRKVKGLQKFGDN